jgi:hypothetical protein
LPGQKPGNDNGSSAWAGGGEVGKVANLGPGLLIEATLIRHLVRLGAEPHQPVAMREKSKGATAVVTLIRRHCLLLQHVEQCSESP